MIAVVAPTIRADRIGDWLARWENFAGIATVYVVEDGPSRSFDAPPDVKHFSWADIDADLCGDSWIIPRRTDAVRSYGYLRAWRDGADYIITLDDDCFPTGDASPAEFVDAHVSRLAAPLRSPAWTSTVGGVMPRGVPYGNVERSTLCVLSHGLWANVPDFDAVTQLGAMRRSVTCEPLNQTIPRGQYFPMCGMNIGWRRALTPAMYFLLMGRDWPYDRLGDIWAGLLVKRICDHLGYGVWSGDPLVWHDRASNVWANLRKEAPGMEMNESLWQTVDETLLTADTISGCYLQLTDSLATKYRDDYWQKLAQAMRIWTGLFR